MVFLLPPNALQLVIKDVSDVPDTSCNNPQTVAEVNVVFNLLKDLPETFEKIPQKIFMYDVGAKTDVVFSTDTYDPDSLKMREGLRWSTGVDIRCSKNIEAFLRNVLRNVNTKSVPFYRTSE